MSKKLDYFSIDIEDLFLNPDKSYINSYCDSINNYFNYGFKLHNIIEFSGEPNSGKTNFAVNLALNNIYKNNKYYYAIYIYTSKNIINIKIENIIKHIQKQHKYLNIDKVYKKFLIIKCDTLDSYFNIINIENLSKYGLTYNNIKTIIIDNIYDLLSDINKDNSDKNEINIFSKNENIKNNIELFKDNLILLTKYTTIFLINNIYDETKYKKYINISENLINIKNKYDINIEASDDDSSSYDPIFEEDYISINSESFDSSQLNIIEKTNIKCERTTIKIEQKIDNNYKKYTIKKPYFYFNFSLNSIINESYIFSKQKNDVKIVKPFKSDRINKNTRLSFIIENGIILATNN